MLIDKSSPYQGLTTGQSITECPPLLPGIVSQKSLGGGEQSVWPTLCGSSSSIPIQQNDVISRRKIGRLPLCVAAQSSPYLWLQSKLDILVAMLHPSRSWVRQQVLFHHWQSALHFGGCVWGQPLRSSFCQLNLYSCLRGWHEGYWLSKATLALVPTISSSPHMESQSPADSPASSSL